MADNSGNYFSYYAAGNQTYPTSYTGMPPTTDFATNVDNSAYSFSVAGFSSQPLQQTAFSTGVTDQMGSYEIAGPAVYTGSQQQVRYSGTDSPYGQQTYITEQATYSNNSGVQTGYDNSQAVYGTGQVGYGSVKTPYNAATTSGNTAAYSATSSNTGSGYNATSNNQSSTLFRGRGRGRGGRPGLGSVRGGVTGAGRTANSSAAVVRPGTTGVTASGSQVSRGPRASTPQQPKAVDYIPCDLCKIQCVGRQQYNEHVSGRAHKKKEKSAAIAISLSAAGVKFTKDTKPGAGAASVPTVSSSAAFFCEVCNIACSGPEVLRSHLAGAKHAKVLKMSGHMTSVDNTQQHPVPTQTTAPRLPAIKFTAAVSTTVKTVTPKQEIVHQELTQDQEQEQSGGDSNMESTAESQVADTPLLGEEYVESIASESGCVVSYHCKLCECTFNNPGARDDHIRGRRHRLTYKKKVDPSIKVDVKSVSRTVQLRQSKQEKQQMKEVHWRQMDMLAGMAEECGYNWWTPAPLPMYMNVPFRHHSPYGIHQRRSLDDKYVMMKHGAIQPSNKTLELMNCMVTSCEKALFNVSELLAAEDAANKPPAAETDDKAVKTETMADESTADTQAAAAAAAAAAGAAAGGDDDDKVLKGAMKVGLFAKDLFIDEDKTAEMVVLCREIPTYTLLQRVANKLITELPKMAGEEKYTIELLDGDGAIVVSREEEPHLTTVISLTSPAIRSQDNTDSTTEIVVPEDALDKEKCLQALADVRRTKWFRVRCQRLRWACIVNRVLRDLSRRVVCWSVLTEWAQELIVEKCICYIGFDVAPAEVLRTIFECISAGLLLPGGTGLYDPCEKEPVDVTEYLTLQQREDITNYAQCALRQLIYREIYKVLDIAKLPRLAPRGWKQKRTNIERSQDNDSSKDASVEEIDEKKLKTDNEPATDE